jgi:hypothetical protein
MKRLLPALLLLSLSAPVAAEEQAGPNTLTPKEAAAGWLLLFDGATTFGWHAPAGPKWHVVEGMLYPEAGDPALLVTNAGFKDYDLRLEYRVRGDARAELRTGCGPDGGIKSKGAGAGVATKPTAAGPAGRGGRPHRPGRQRRHLPQHQAAAGRPEAALQRQGPDGLEGGQDRPDEVEVQRHGQGRAERQGRPRRPADRGPV